MRKGLTTIKGESNDAAFPCTIINGETGKLWGPTELEGRWASFCKRIMEKGSFWG